MRPAPRLLPIKNRRATARGFSRALAPLICSFALVVVAGCGYGSAGGTPQTAARGGRATLVAHSSTAEADRNAMATATAHCASGEKLLSGGFAADIFEADAIVASYPSAADAWTVSGSSPASSITLTAYAYCLANGSGVDLEQVQVQSSGTSATASCPAGAILTGGGYQGAAPKSSFPEGNGWALEWSGGQSARVWALCAIRGLTAAPLATTQYTLAAGYGVSGGGSASCGAGQLVTGGGFRNDGLYALIENALTSDGADWSVGANANTNTPSVTPGGTVYAVCVTQ